MGQPVNCFKCKHFAISWDTQRPYGCKAWGIKSRQHPSLVVRSSSNLECQLFQSKDSGKKGHPSST